MVLYIAYILSRVESGGVGMSKKSSSSKGLYITYICRRIYLYQLNDQQHRQKQSTKLSVRLKEEAVEF